MGTSTKYRIKRDLARKGFSLVDSKGNEVDPYSVDWSKYSKGIPYRVVQGSGDANALGIMKFVFSNKYSVYLHDTNQRYLFGNAMRSLSHGCVRVQEWEKLAYYILRNDSLNAGSSGYTKIDSLKTWLQKKQKRSIAVRNKIPVYIRYILFFMTMFMLKIKCCGRGILPQNDKDRRKINRRGCKVPF